MSFLKKLFGGGKPAGSGPANEHAHASHDGFDIITTPMEEGGQFRVAAMIRKEVNGEVKTHRLIRADLCSTADEASEIALRKSRQMIDERGERVFG